MQRENEIPKSSLTSAVTTDMANDAEDQEASGRAMEEHYEGDALIASGLGLIKVDGIDKRYVGLPPALDPNDAELPSGLKITPDNSTFIPLWQVPFSNSIEIKDPTTGTFYYPGDTATSWQTCELDGNPLVPPVEPPPETGEPGNGGGGATSEERSFAGDGTDTLAVDVITGSAGSVAIEGDVYPVPPYTQSPTNDALVTSDASVWQAGVNVLVTAEFADAGLVDTASADSKSKKKEADKKSGKKK